MPPCLDVGVRNGLAAGLGRGGLQAPALTWSARLRACRSAIACRSSCSTSSAWPSSEPPVSAWHRSPRASLLPRAGALARLLRRAPWRPGRSWRCGPQSAAAAALSTRGTAPQPPGRRCGPPHPAAGCAQPATCTAAPVSRPCDKQAAGACTAQLLVDRACEAGERGARHPLTHGPRACHRSAPF
jgi:hypothetical protein